MKRILTLVLAALLVLSVLCGALAEASPDLYAGLWADPAIGRAELSIMPIDPRDAEPGAQQYRVLLTWGSSASEHSAWTMTARLEDGALVYTDGRHDDITFGEDGEETDQETEYEDGTGTLAFSHEGPSFTWHDDKTGEDYTFEWVKGLDAQEKE